ncbi:radical SAM family heme chaperone HemW [candidate division KSB1 bacterium]|nr:radical SAM family heme chaperone HemW [candidate division KSB1 bacterium]
MALAGLYVHIPFCIQKCCYCDFFSITDLSKKTTYLDALTIEWKMYLQNPPFGGFHFDTLYFGGGTPSVYDASDLKKIISRITPYLSQNVELTCEVNPATLSREQLARYRDIGINRLSIGVQSFHDQELAFLGRIHRAAEAEQFIQHVKSSGFENWGIDLIFGIPGQTIDSWRDSLRRTLALAPKHISLYGLTVEEGTPLASAVHSRRVRLCHEESERHMYLLALELLGKAGYEHYEISNFSLPGFRS